MQKSDLESRILFEDNHLLVVNKPPGISTEGPKSDTLENQLAKMIKERETKPGKVFLRTVHRLDRLVSGIVVLAKTSKALARLHRQIREGDWVKSYLAKLEREPQEPKGELMHYLVKKDHRAEVVGDEKEGKWAKLVYEKRADGLYEITLITGRYHQIRAQFAAIDCPIVGDEKYGAKKVEGDEIALCHFKLAFTHPVRKDPLLFLLEWDWKPRD